MISVEEVITIYIQYRGSRQGLFTDYGSAFDHYLEYFQQDLKKCSLFEPCEKANSLCIRYRNKQFLIYHSDERAARWGITYTYNNETDATNKFLELYQIMCKKDD